MNTFTLTLTDEQLASLQFLNQTSQCSTLQEELEKCVRYGIDNRVYRVGFNRKQNQIRKNEQAELDTLRSKLRALEAAEKLANRK